MSLTNQHFENSFHSSYCVA